jgi:hypothetical protein
VSLEELFSGATKKLKVTRSVLDPRDYTRTVEESKVVEIEVKASAAPLSCAADSVCDRRGGRRGRG